MPVQDIQIRMEGDPGYKPDSTIPAGTIFSALNPRALQRDPLREAYNNQDSDMSLVRFEDLLREQMEG